MENFVIMPKFVMITILFTHKMPLEVSQAVSSLESHNGVFC